MRWLLLVAVVDAAILGARVRSTRAALAAFAAVVLSGLVVQALVRSGRVTVRRLPPIKLLVGLALGTLLGFALFSGTGIQRHHLQLPLVTITALLGAFVARWSSPWQRLARLPSWLFALAAAALYAVHALVLVRQYPLLHGVLAAGVLVLASRALRDRFTGKVALAVALLATVALGAALRPMTVRAAVRRAPIAQYLALAVGALLPHDEAVAETRRPVWGSGPPLPLAGRDVVLVTIDALRADRLRALGGRGAMPTLDAMASRGIVFRRAYCTTPHTSYSLASMMLGTHARAVLALPGPMRHHETLGEWMHAAGYETAAFFPPAVFAVDGDRFADLRARHFGFAHDDVSYASGIDRAAAVSRWLDTQNGAHRVFVWVHLFEPHEPYEVHPEHPSGPSPEARYDAECSAADDALARLRAVFANHHRAPAWIVTADHGEEFGDHGGTFHGTSVYDEQVRVPWVMEVAGVGPREVREAVSHVDLVPTLLSGIGARRPPRLRGVDLGGVAQGVALTGVDVFSATGSLRAVIRGRHKLILDERDDTFELFDLDADSRERTNLADRHPDLARHLRGRIAGWESEHAVVEAEADAAPEVPVPPALAQAEQGSVTAAGEVVAVLQDERAAVRMRAARVLGDLGDARPSILAALRVVLGAREAPLADEAALSLALLGDGSGRERVTALLRGESSDPNVFRAALGLARLHDARGVSVLAQVATQTSASDAVRDQAIAALRSLRSREALPTWVTLLGSDRLGPVAAEALGELGDRRAVEPLSVALETTRYATTRGAILRALVSLESPVARTWLVAHLDTIEAVPGRVALLRDAGVLGREVRGATRRVAMVAGRPVRWPATGATARRVAWLGAVVRATQATTVQCVGWGRVEVRAGEQEVVYSRAGAPQAASGVTCRADEALEVVAVALW